MGLLDLSPPCWLWCRDGPQQQPCPFAFLLPVVLQERWPPPPCPSLKGGSHLPVSKSNWATATTLAGILYSSKHLIRVFSPPSILQLFTSITSSVTRFLLTGLIIRWVETKRLFRHQSTSPPLSLAGSLGKAEIEMAKSGLGWEASSLQIGSPPQLSCPNPASPLLARHLSLPVVSWQGPGARLSSAPLWVFGCLSCHCEVCQSPNTTPGKRQEDLASLSFSR